MTFFKYIIIALANILALNVWGQYPKTDTAFIVKDNTYGTAQSIYIHPNKKNKFYKDIVQFHFSKFDTVSYNSSMDYFKEKNVTLTKNKPVTPITKWVTLKVYKGSFYAYRPCDFYSHYQSSINDSTYIDWTGEGPVANKIIAQKKTDEKTFEFKLTGMYNENRALTIHIINAAKGIALFEEVNDSAKHFYLMIAADKINSVPIIVNSCQVFKQVEQRFEAPEVEKLMNKSN